MTQSAGSLCLVHLVWAPLGTRPLREFAQALRAHPPGVEHSLVVAFNGFASAAEAGPYLDELAGLDPEVLLFPEGGQDLAAYFATAARLRRERYCFVNSYSRPLVDGWLAKLDTALARPGVGLVGASGSWASSRSWMAHSLGLPSAYRGLLPAPRAARAQLLAVELEHAGAERRSRRESLQARWSALRQLPQLERFPAHHLRTNAFMVSHAILSRLRLRPVRDKLDAYALEHGRGSITRQVQRIGLRTLVVDRDGAVYDHPDWDRSRTFWQGDQEGLLVADNRTLGYQRADRPRRRVLAAYAWGAAAAPYGGGYGEGVCGEGRSEEGGYREGVREKSGCGG